MSVLVAVTYIYLDVRVRVLSKRYVRYMYMQGLCKPCHGKADYIQSFLSFSIVTAVQSLELSYACRHQKLTSYVYMYI